MDVNQNSPAHRLYRWELLALLCFAFFNHQGDRAVFGVVLPMIKSELQLTDAQLGLIGTTLFMTPVGFSAIVFVNNAYVVWAPSFVQEKFDLSLTAAGPARCCTTTSRRWWEC